jgi:hypothetical protein
MRQRQPSFDRSAVEQQIAQMRTSAEEFGANDGLYGVQQSVQDTFAAGLKELGYMVHGRPDVDPDVVLERAATMRQRAREASSKAESYFEGLRRSEASAGPPRPLGWRMSLAVVSAAAVVGLAMPSAGWRVAGILALSATLAALVLPLIPRALRRLMVGAHDLAVCLGELVLAAFAMRECRRLERRGWAAADQRARVEEWVTLQMSQLGAVYDHHKGLAMVARLSS